MTSTSQWFLNRRDLVELCKVNFWLFLEYKKKIRKGRVGNIGVGGGEVGFLCQLKQSNNQSFKTI